MTGEVTKVINKEVIKKCQRSNSSLVPKLVLDTEVSVTNDFPSGWELALTPECKSRTGKN